MEYDFSFDQNGHPQAEFSLDHELLGYWFTDELGNNTQRCQSLIDQIEILERNNFGEHVISGKQLSLSLTPHEVIISRDDYGFDDDESLAEHGLEAMEHKADCGLQDFKAVVLDWKIFVAK